MPQVTYSDHLVYRFEEDAQARRVFTPTSPKLSLSGMAPMPKESRTIKKIRFIKSPDSWLIEKIVL